MEKYAKFYVDLEAEPDIDRKKTLQNAYWCSIYQMHKDEAAINFANRDFLLCRDICIMTLWLLLAYLGACALSILPFYWKLVVFFVIEFVLTSVAVRGKGGCLARSVLASDIHPNKEKEYKWNLTAGLPENKCLRDCGEVIFRMTGGYLTIIKCPEK